MAAEFTRCQKNSLRLLDCPSQIPEALQHRGGYLRHLVVAHGQLKPRHRAHKLARFRIEIAACVLGEEVTPVLGGHEFRVNGLVVGLAAWLAQEIRQ